MDEIPGTIPTFSFKPTRSIFKEREALLEEWTPDELVGRDEELTQYHAALQSVIEGETPSNIFIYGKSGVGKTVATRFLLKRLERDATNIDGLNLHTIEINYDGLNTSYQTGSRSSTNSAIRQIRSPTQVIPKHLSTNSSSTSLISSAALFSLSSTR